MNTQHLLYFVKTVEFGSIGKAARELMVNHSSIIYAINELEKTINQTLLVREKNRVIVTEIGERVCEDAKLILAVVNSWQSGLPANGAIQYSIDAVPSIFNTVLPKLIQEIKIIYPGITVQSKEIASITEVLSYQEELPDIFLSSSFEKNSLVEQRLCSSQNIEKLPLFKSKVAFFCNKSCLDKTTDSITIEEVSKIPLCTYFVASIDLNPLMPLLRLKELYFVENQLEAIEQLKTKKVGTILPEFLRSFPELIDPEKIRVYNFSETMLYSYISLYYPRSSRKSYIANRILNIIKKYPYTTIEGVEKYNA